MPSTSYYTGPWTAWNDTYTTTTWTTTNSSCTSSTWDAWNYYAPRRRDSVWYAWNGATSTTTANLYVEPRVVETDEQRAAREERERQRAADAAEAKARATELLLSVLDEQQAADFLERKEFTVEGSDGKRYLIREGRMHNVFEIDEDGNRVVEICGHVRPHIPNEDNLAAQKLALETDAPRFLQIANRWDLTRGRATIQREAA